MQMSISQMDKLWNICTMEFYMAMRINDLQKCTMVRLNLTTTVLNKRIQTKKRAFCVIPFIQSSKHERLVYGMRNQKKHCLWVIT